MCALVGGGGATGGAGRRPEMGESQPRNTQKIPHIRKDLDQRRHLFSATSATSTSSKVVTVSTSERRSRQKTAASALCGISRRRTREGGRARVEGGRLWEGRDGAGASQQLKQTPIHDPRHPTILVRGGTLNQSTSKSMLTTKIRN